MSHKGRVINPPDRIFLQVVGDYDGPEDTHYLGVPVEEITWHDERIFDADLEYRLVRPAKHQLGIFQDAANEIKRLRKTLQSISLGAQNSMTMKEDLGRLAREALASSAKEQQPCETCGGSGGIDAGDQGDVYRCLDCSPSTVSEKP